MASSAGAAHMVHLCNIWANPWEQYEICQCQSQTLCAHPCIPTSGVRRITITTSLRSSIWSRTHIATEDEKKLNSKLFGFQILENCRPEWKSQCIVQGVYRTASSQGAARHCPGANTCLLSRSWEEHGWWRLSDWKGKFRGVSPNIVLNDVTNSRVGWKSHQVQLELVLSWAGKWAWWLSPEWRRSELCRICAPHCCLLPFGTLCALTLAAAFGIGHPS